MSTESEIDGDEFNSSLGCSLAKKRKRADSDFAEVETMVVEQGSDSPTSPAAADSGPIVRDRNYYLEDGSCILLVQDTLFNVHRTMLSKDGSSFSTMFSLPQGDKPAEGKADDNPIILRGDTVSEFRHFLWALYALPPELCLLSTPGTDLTPLIDIARVSNKYTFKSLETWALDAIQEYVNRKPSPILPLPPSPAFAHVSSTVAVESTAQLTRLIRLAQLCNHERLLNAMITLLRQLMTTSLQYAYLAMTLADELDLRTLRGVAYLEMMQKAVVVKRSSSVDEGEVDEDGRLVINSSQQLRLLSGYYRLTKTWEKLRTTPPAFDHSPSCGATWHQHGCTQSWLEFWKEKTRGDAVLSLGLADVLGRLKQVQKDYDRWGSATYMHHDCRLAARRSIMEMIKTVEDGLPEYFSESDEGT